MEICVKFLLFPYYIFYSVFQTWFYQIRWFYQYRSFKRNEWWRHKLGHT